MNKILKSKYFTGIMAAILVVAIVPAILAVSGIFNGNSESSDSSTIIPSSKPSSPSAISASIPIEPRGGSDLVNYDASSLSDNSTCFSCSTVYVSDGANSGIIVTDEADVYSQSYFDLKNGSDPLFLVSDCIAAV